ncbi:cluster of Differentiation 80/86 isoform 2-T3 [Spinachia spinachia]
MMVHLDILTAHAQTQLIDCSIDDSLSSTLLIMKRKYLSLPLKQTQSCLASAMESHGKHRFVTVKIFLQLLVLITTRLTDVTGAASFPLIGEVGGEVTFHCPVDKQRTLAFLYIQKGEIFVNGYHAENNVTGQAWNNTRVDLDKSTLLMYNLKPSHDGDYTCIIRYKGKMRIEPEIQLRLTVTANYSKPELTVHCTDTNRNFSCLLQCTSHGGLGDASVTWHLPRNFKVTNNSKIRDPDTTTFNISNTAYVNCSDGQPTSFRCSVDNVSSDIVSVCTPKDPPGHSPSVTAAAICAAGVGFCFMVALLARCYCQKGPRRAAA